MLWNPLIFSVYWQNLLQKVEIPHQKKCDIFATVSKKMHSRDIFSTFLIEYPIIMFKSNLESREVYDLNLKFCYQNKLKLIVSRN